MLAHSRNGYVTNGKLGCAPRDARVARSATPRSQEVVQRSHAAVTIGVEVGFQPMVGSWCGE